jgi:hypothetical protein
VDPPFSPPPSTSPGFCQGFLIILLILNIDSKELAHLHLHRSPDLGHERKLSLTFIFNIVWLLQSVCIPDMCSKS